MAQGNLSPIRASSRAAPRVRRARAEDLPAIAALYRELHLGQYGIQTVSARRMRTAFAAIARDRDHSLLVAERAGRVVGTLHLFIFRHLGHGLRPVAIIENVVVSAQERSGGIGAQMLAAAGTMARRRNCYKMSLTSNAARRRAHRFYERLGWRRSHFGFTLTL